MTTKKTTGTDQGILTADALEHIPAACYCCDASGRLTAWNSACEKMYGLPAADALESVVWERLAPKELHHQFRDYMARTLQGEVVESVEWDNLHFDGTRRIIRSSISPLRARRSEDKAAAAAAIAAAAAAVESDIIGSLVINTDVTEERRAVEETEQELQRLQRTCFFLQQQKTRMKQELSRLKGLTTTDSLTGLRNRRAFRERLGLEYERACRYGNSFSLFFVDIDQFRQFNDAHGATAGDQALVAVAALLRQQMRAVDFAGRYGGEEFVLILPDTDREGAVALGNRLREAATEITLRDTASANRHHHSSRPVSDAASSISPPVTVSIGGITFPDAAAGDSLTKGAIIALADCALYHAKQQGRNTLTHYDDLSPDERQRLAALFTPRKY